MKILAISASTNDPSNSDLLADHFLAGAKQAGALVTKIRLKDLTIDHFRLDFYDPQCHQEEDFCKVQEAIQSADGILIASPVWNFGVPAQLKNLIDRMGSFALDETRSRGTLGGKPFYLIFTGGAPLPVWRGLMGRTTSFVPEAVKYFGGSILGIHFEPRCTKGRGEFGLVVDARPESLAAVRKQGEAFAKIVKDYAETGRLPLKQSIVTKVYAIGQRIAKMCS